MRPTTYDLALPNSVARHLAQTVDHPAVLSALRDGSRRRYGRGYRRYLSVDEPVARALEKILRQHAADIATGDLSPARTGVRPEALRRAVHNVTRQIDYQSGPQQ